MTVSLKDCPAGPFVSSDGILCVKTEETNGAFHAYIFESGYEFKGDSKTREERDDQQVSLLSEYIEESGLVEEIADVIGYHLASLISGNNQPVMSGDPRDRLSHKLRQRLEAASIEATKKLIPKIIQSARGT